MRNYHHFFHYWPISIIAFSHLSARRSVEKEKKWIEFSVTPFIFVHAGIFNSKRFGRFDVWYVWHNQINMLYPSPSLLPLSWLQMFFAKNQHWIEEMYFCATFRNTNINTRSGGQTSPKYKVCNFVEYLLFKFTTKLTKSTRETGLETCYPSLSLIVNTLNFRQF